MTGIGPDPVTADVASATSAPVRDVAAEEVRRVAAEHGVTPAELVQRLRDVVRGVARDASLCDWCEGPMPDETSPTQRYCSNGCRKEASRYRVARRRLALQRAAAGELLGSCDVCGKSCDVKDALCVECIDAMNERYRDAMDVAQAEKNREEGTRV